MASTDVSPTMRMAQLRLAEAVAGLDLTEVEQRKLGWLLRWEPETVDAFASIIAKARETA